jgi:stage II sporulation protein D
MLRAVPPLRVRPRAPPATGPSRTAGARLGWALLALLRPGCGGAGPRPLLAASSAPVVRVRLGSTRPQATLQLPAGGWEVSSTGGRAFARRGEGAARTAIAASGAAISVFGAETGATSLRVTSREPFVLDGVAYPGLLVVRRDGTALAFVNEVDLEIYLAGVVPHECAPGAEPSTQRAQAVVARTYAWLRCGTPGAEEQAWHLRDDESSQVYRGLEIPPSFGSTLEQVRLRVQETRGVVLAWRSRPFPAYYSSTCGGHTTEAETSRLDPQGATEPLRGVPCNFCSTSRYYRWERTVGDADIVAGLAARGYPVLEPIHAIEVTAVGRGQWAQEVTLVQGPQRSERRVPGTDFRSALRLRSHRIFRAVRTPGGWTLQGAGWGHGVGMCQWGAHEMGRRGFSETDILRYYYPGITFTRLW